MSIWLIPIAFAVIGAGAYWRVVRKSRRQISFPQEPVSGQWLAEARGREEHHW
jgi:cytochrome c-type biogenesis protein CcmH/NrfF